MYELIINNGPVIRIEAKAFTIVGGGYTVLILFYKKKHVKVIKTDERFVLNKI